jgi:hypothetical protein
MYTKSSNNKGTIYLFLVTILARRVLRLAPSSNFNGLAAAIRPSHRKIPQ